jgi:anti-sigma factor ChrR (cupin superfamily)
MQRELAGANNQLSTARSDSAAQVARGSAMQGELAARDERIAALGRELEGRDRRIEELEHELREALEGHEALRKARRREADATYLAGIAAEVFNRSPHLDEILTLAERLGEPVVRIAPEGIALPRPVRVILGWPQGWRSYRVRCDLVARLFEVEPVAGALHGKLETPLGPLRPNASLVDGRLVAGTATV